VEWKERNGENWLCVWGKAKISTRSDSAVGVNGVKVVGAQVRLINRTRAKGEQRWRSKQGTVSRKSSWELQGASSLMSKRI